MLDIYLFGYRIASFTVHTEEDWFKTTEVFLIPYYIRIHIDIGIYTKIIRQRIAWVIYQAKNNALH